MAFNQRQLAEVYPLIEVAYVTLTPGAVGNGTTVYATAAATTTPPGVSPAVPATAVNGDYLETIAPAGAALNGVQIQAVPTATPGTYGFYFTNNTGGSVTPVASSVYKVIAARIPPNFF